MSRLQGIIYQLSTSRIPRFVGAFLLLVAGVLLIVTCISAPAVQDISLLRVSMTYFYQGIEFTETQKVVNTYGVTGYCQSNSYPTCTSNTGSQINYSIGGYDGQGFDNYSALLVIPVATVFTFIALFFTLGTNFVWSSIAAALGWLFTTIAMSIALSIFGSIRDGVNSEDIENYAEYGPAMWTLVVAFILHCLRMVIVAFSFYAERRKAGRKDVELNNMDTARVES